MATKKEIKEHLKMALEEISQIEPWFDNDYKMWVFSHALYPVEYSGDTKEEVVENYPLYLKDFIDERLRVNLSDVTENKTKGRGGRRIGSGSPAGTKKEPKKRVSLPKDCHAGDNFTSSRFRNSEHRSTQNSGLRS